MPIVKNNLLSRFNQFILAKKLFGQKDRVLLAVSGGIDSVVMAYLFKEAGFSFGIAHANFGLRGKESDDDELFVKKLAVKLDVPFFKTKFDTRKEAVKVKISIQMAARQLRYEWLEETRKKNKFHFLALAHHLNDITETMLINLLRGTGIAGLHGILPVNGKIIRPLLFASKKELQIYAKNNKLSWREDSSNEKNDYTRNLIRHKVLPVFEKINPAFETTFSENALRFHHCEMIVNEYIENLKPQVMFKDDSKTIKLVKGFFAVHPAGATLLYELLKEFGFNPEVTGDMIKAAVVQPGKIFYSDTHQLVSDRDFFILSPLEEEPEEAVITQHADHLEITQPQFILKIYPLKMDKKSYGQITSNKDRRIAYADAEKVKFPISVRTWHEGDYFYPLGMKGKKKLSDFYIDLKLSLTEKERTWLLCDSGKIIWIMGHRLDSRVAIDIKTKNYYRFEFTSR